MVVALLQVTLFVVKAQYIVEILILKVHYIMEEFVVKVWYIVQEFWRTKKVNQHSYLECIVKKSLEYGRLPHPVVPHHHHPDPLFLSGHLVKSPLKQTGLSGTVTLLLLAPALLLPPLFTVRCMFKRRSVRLQIVRPNHKYNKLRLSWDLILGWGS